MSETLADCCAPRLELMPGRRVACASCGRPGRAVDEVTLKALLKPEALARRAGSEHLFCPSADCPVVYFGEDDVFSREDVAAPVFQKERAGRRIVCHCLGIDEETIHGEVAASGTSPSAERIKALVQSGGCACEVRNPQGTCCLGNVATVVGLAAGVRAEHS